LNLHTRQLVLLEQRIVTLIRINTEDKYLTMTLGPG